MGRWHTTFWVPAESIERSASRPESFGCAAACVDPPQTTWLRQRSTDRSEKTDPPAIIRRGFYAPVLLLEITPMGRPTDQTLAKLMLEYRNHGFTFRNFLRRSVKAHSQFILIMGSATAVSAWLDSYWATIVASSACGALLRDFAWFRTSRRQWPFGIERQTGMKSRELPLEMLPNNSARPMHG